jgi:hypothetical protein
LRVRVGVVVKRGRADVLPEVFKELRVHEAGGGVFAADPLIRGADPLIRTPRLGRAIRAFPSLIIAGAFFRGSGIRDDGREHGGAVFVGFVGTFLFGTGTFLLR